MPRSKVCRCNDEITKSNRFEFKIKDSKIELRCRRCTGLVAGWNVSPKTNKIMPSKRAWSHEECLAMR
ncbi:MAG: hypothetical protein WA941_20510 [Nitrososphaeraceae archaeon]